MKKNSGLIIFVAVLASLLEIVDTSIVNVALPTMMGNLGATLEDISMIITGYAIANAIVLPVSGWLSERIGRRKYYLGCIAAFTFFSVACGLVPNLFFLIICRIFQGMMGGALLPTSQSLIYEQFPPEKAGTAGAIFGMSVMIGPALGPVLGGYLTDQFGWRSIFNINLPLGLLALFVGLAVIFDREKNEEEKKVAESRSFDGVGLALLILGVGCLQFVLERGEADDWFSSNTIIVNAIISAICLPSFIWWELRVKNPIINVRLFKDAIVVCGVSLMAFLGFFLYGLVFLLPVFVQSSYHFTATQTGILFIPGSILTAMMMPFVGRLMSMGKSTKGLILIGLLSLEVCMYTLTFLSPLSSKWDVLTILYIRGFALAFLFVPINSSILSQYRGASMGQVSGLLNLFRQLGGSAGVALVATLINVNSHQNFLDLTSKVSLLNHKTSSFFYSTMNGLNGKFSDLTGMLNAHEGALKVLNGKLQSQVFMLSFNQLIWTMMIIFSFSLVPWYFLQLRRKPQGPVLDAH